MNFVPPVKWLVGELGLCVEDISTLTAPPGTSVEGLSHSPKRGGGGGGVLHTNGIQQPRLCLTPLTSEACLMEGIDPLDLFSRDLDSFTYAGADRAVATLRAGAFERLRGDKLALIRAARAALSEGRLPASFGGGKAPPSVSSPRTVASRNNHHHGGGGGASATRASTHSTQQSITSSSVLGESAFQPDFSQQQLDGSSGANGGGETPMEIEAARLARIQKRQQRELAQLIAGELRLAEARKTADEKANADNSRAADRALDLASKKAAALEESRMRELKRQIAEQEEMARNVRRALIFAGAVGTLQKKNSDF